MRLSLTLLVAVAISGCQCGGDVLVRTGVQATDGGLDGGSGGGAAGGGTATSTGGGTVATGGGTNINTSWCASDCDCPANQRCVSTGNGELTENICQPGVSMCTAACPQPCGSGTQCTNGVCTPTPCTGTNCSTTWPVSVAGAYSTYYELDIHTFANKAADIANLLQVLGAALNGQGANCGNQTTVEGKLLCIIVDLIAQNIHAPPWVGQLITVLGDAFKFGNSPIRARGTLTVAESGAKLYGSEVWKEMWLQYNGQQLNVINNPVLGANGNITVTVRAFNGTRTATEVNFGPREVEFDVNKLIVNLLNVVISAASNNQAHDVGGLLNLILCNQIPSTSSNYLVCTLAAQEIAKNFTLDSGLGGVSISSQKALIYDADHNLIADSLGLPTARGSVAGEMSNGFVSGGLGAFPASSWYGTK